MLSYIEMHQSTRAVMDHHKYVEHAKSRCDRHEEDTRDDCLGVVSQECRPALIASGATRWPLGHVLAHCSRRDPHSELEQQLISDPLFTPQRVLRCHAPNQLPQLQW